MGCYVLLKIRLVKETREENHYEARQYKISKVDGEWNGTIYYLVYGNCWHISFTQNHIKCVHCNGRKDYYYGWTDDYRNNVVTEIHNNLANCRFDLVYSLMNKI